MVILVMLQSVIFSNLTLLGGTVDIIMLAILSWSLQRNVKNAWEWALVGGIIVGYVSAIPVYVPLIGYLALSLGAHFLQERIWQTPILAMFFTTVVGSIFMSLFTIISLQFMGTPITFGESFSLVAMPSALLNLLLSLPVYLLFRDMASWVYPVEEEL